MKDYRTVRCRKVCEGEERRGRERVGEREKWEGKRSIITMHLHYNLSVVSWCFLPQKSENCPSLSPISFFYSY